MFLESILASHEGKTLEFKRDLSSPAGVVRTIVAFANTSGGILVIGVDDKTKNVRGVTSPLDTEEKLVNIVSDSIYPLLSPDISVVPWRHTQIISVEVFPSSSRPHHIRREGPDKGVYIRVGSSNRRADAALIADLNRQVRSESYDEQPMPALSSEAIDFRVASELFAGVRRLKLADLLTLRMIAKHQNKTVPTIGGVLLFGIDRQNHFPDAWIQAGRFQGTDRSKIADSVLLHSHLIGAIDECIAFIRKHVNVESRIDDVRRRDRWSIPLPAIREALINSVVHADYSQSGAPIRVSIFDDRIEFENPGLLPFGLTVDDIRRGVSKLRNRAIGRVFHALGLIEQWGSGVQRMIGACQDAGLKEPQLEEIGVHFRVTLFFQREREPQVDDLDRTIIDFLVGGTGRSTNEIATKIDRSTRATRTRLASLVERGLVREIGTSPRDPKRKYIAVNIDR
jgi:ATP-dependent DNA helicase RecG